MKRMDRLCIIWTWHCGGLGTSHCIVSGSSCSGQAKWRSQNLLSKMISSLTFINSTWFYVIFSYYFVITVSPFLDIYIYIYIYIIITSKTPHQQSTPAPPSKRQNTQIKLISKYPMNVIWYGNRYLLYVSRSIYSDYLVLALIWIIS